MTDDEFLQAFMNCTLPNDQFRHRDHLHLAWLLARRLGFEEARVAIAEGIRRFAASHGHTEKYHETMTQFWIRIVDHASKQRPDIDDFDEFLATFPHLTDKLLPLRHWQRETMFSPEARTAWVEPDLLQLPAHVPGRT
jgi:hypothetical protein